MPILNYTSREITVKIVYYGPALSGKTTNVKYISSVLPREKKGKMVTLPTKEDRTLFFDFLPFSLGGKSGYRIRLQLYTVPGQVIYDSTRRLVLQGADGVVFVADSQKALLENNLESLENMKANLKRNGLNFYKIPLVLQYNKRDLPNILPVEKLDSLLNERGVPSIAAIAIKGEGVIETLIKIAELTLKNLQSKYTVLEELDIDSLLEDFKDLEPPAEFHPEEIPVDDELPLGNLPEEEQPEEIPSIFSPDEETNGYSKEQLKKMLEENQREELNLVNEEPEEIPEQETEVEFLEDEQSFSLEEEEMSIPEETKEETKKTIRIPINLDVNEGEEIDLIIKFRIKIKKSGKE